MHLLVYIYQGLVHYMDQYRYRELSTHIAFIKDYRDAILGKHPQL